ncbi:MAG: ATP-binding protein, partial [Myxococcota bacterium]
ISGSVEMLQEMRAEGEDERMLMNIVTREVRRLDTLISQFLEYSRPRELHLNATHLSALLEELLRLFRAGTEGVIVTLDLDDALRTSRLKLDAEAMRQIIWNLLNNAAEAMHQDASLESLPDTALLEPSERISGSFPRAALLSHGNYPRIDIRAAKVERDGLSLLQLDVEDNGPGISEEAAERIFEPFFTTKDQGTGLGLATIFRLVEQHGGSIRVSAPQRLRGARFTVELPYVRAREQEHVAQARGA